MLPFRARSSAAPPFNTLFQKFLNPTQIFHPSTLSLLTDIWTPQFFIPLSTQCRSQGSKLSLRLSPCPYILGLSPSDTFESRFNPTLSVPHLHPTAKCVWGKTHSHIVWSHFLSALSMACSRYPRQFTFPKSETTVSQNDDLSSYSVTK